MADNRPKDKDEVPLNTCVIPENFAYTGRCFDGMFRTRNLVEGAILAGPIAYFTVHLDLPLNQKAFVTALTAGLVFLGCLNGINGDSVSECLIHLFSYLKHKRIARYNPRVRIEAKPGYLTKENGELPREKLKRFIDDIQKRRGKQEAVSSEIYDPIYKEFFEDDLGVVETPDDLKSHSERRRAAKEKKRTEKQQRREEKVKMKAEKRAAKQAEKEAKKEAKRNKKRGV